MDSKTRILSREHSCFNRFMFELRSVEHQQDRMRFRKNIERCAQILGYEISKEFPYKSETVQTPLGELDMDIPESHPVVVSILRAGLPMHQGLLEYFDGADNGFISAYRHTTKGNEFIVKVEYLALPSLEGRILILTDPMIATGKSMVLSYKAMVPQYGTPDQVFVAGIIGSEEGVDYVRRNMPQARLFIGAVDGELTAKSYIVPGLGDAGDLAFGAKE